MHAAPSPNWGAGHLAHAVVIGTVAVTVTLAAVPLAERVLASTPLSPGAVSEWGAAIGMLTGAVVLAVLARGLPAGPDGVMPWGRLRFDGFAVGCALALLAIDVVMVRLIEGTLGVAPSWIAPPNDGLDATLGFLFATVVAAPVAEEMLFRGVLHGAVGRVLGRGAAIVLPTLLFAGIHADQGWLYVLAILPGSFVLAFARERSGGIALPIVLHMIGNASADIQLWLEFAGPVRG